MTDSNYSHAVESTHKILNIIKLKNNITLKIIKQLSFLDIYTHSMKRFGNIWLPTEKKQ